MIIAEDVSQVPGLRDQHPQDTILVELDDGTKYYYRPGRLEYSIRLLPGADYTPRYTS